MEAKKLNNLYFDWMASLAIPDTRKRKLYSKLLQHLHNSVFYFTLPLDENRYADGLDLRYRFGWEHGYSNDVIGRTIDTRETTMLEMMVALALRGEERIMSDNEFGNRMSNWFMEMIESLKLKHMTDLYFNPHWVDSRIDDLLNHDYAPDGEGGLFTVKNPRQDMRTVDIWYQMCWYMDSILKE